MKSHEFIGSGSGTSVGYVIEARSILKDPCQFGDQLFGPVWRQVEFSKGPIGVSNGLDGREWEFNHGLGLCRLYTYSAARALAYWLLNEARNQWRPHCGLTVRIVQVEVKYEYTSKETGVTDAMLDSYPPKGDFKPRDAQDHQAQLALTGGREDLNGPVPAPSTSSGRDTQ